MPIWLIQIVVGLVLSLASQLAQQVFAQPKTQQQKAAAGIRGTLQSGGDLPLSFLVGTIGVPGKLEYAGTWGNSGETPNAYFTQIVSYQDLIADGFAAIYVNGQAGTIEGVATGDLGLPITEYRVGGVEHLWVNLYYGTQTTAPGLPLSVFGSDADRPWQAGMIGRGISYAVVTALINRELWSGTPAILFQMRGIKLYDPRKDTTAGGSGAQRRNDTSTWAFSDNPAVIIYNILIGIRYGGDWLWGMQEEIDKSRLPYANWAAAMDVCDESVALDGGGSETRFRCGREIKCDERPIEVITELLVACNGRISEAAGKYTILAGAPGSAAGSFTDADIIVSEEQSLEPFPGFDDVINGATATYLEPTQAWERKETAPYYRNDLEAEDDDRRQLAGLALDAVFSGTQAQRIQKAVVEDARRFARHVVVLPPGFGIYRPLDTLAWTSTRNGYSSKLFLVTAVEEAENGNVVIGLQETDPSDHDWTAATDEQPLTFTPITPIRPPAQPMTGFAVSPYVFPDAVGTGRRPGILVEYTGGLEDVRAVAFEVREDFGSGNTVAVGEITYDITIASPAQPIGGQWTLPNTDYEVRAKFLPFSGRLTDWSSWLAVTTPNVKLTEDDIDLTLAGLDAFLQEKLAWLNKGVRGLIQAFERTGTLIAQQDLANYNDRQTLKRQIVSQLGEVEASFTELIEVATGPGSAIGTSLEELYAALGGNSSQVNVRMEAVAAPTGYTASYAVQAAVDDGAFRQAAFGIDVPASALDPTRFWVIADQFVIFSDSDATDTHLPFVFESGQAIIETVRFRNLKSIAVNGSGDPIVEIDGDTGAFTFGA